MSVIICPGIHEPALTQSFLSGLRSLFSDSSNSSQSGNLLVFPAQDYSASVFPDGSNSSQSGNLLVFPAQDYPAYSAFHILQFVCDRLRGSGEQGQRSSAKDEMWFLRSAIAPRGARLGTSQERELVFISFSAGVVGAIGAALGWQLMGGHVKAFIALDGWGVPLAGNFPIHRLSHDYFTHWSCAVLGSGEDSFYADPPVEHLELWRSPQTATGWWVTKAVGKSQPRSPLTAAEFLTMLLERYGELKTEG